MNRGDVTTIEKHMLPGTTPAATSLLSAVPGLLVMLVSCTDVGLQPAVGQGAAVYDDELHLTGEVCLSPDTDAVFPVKVLFLVDTSDSMSVTDRDMKRKTP